MNKNNWPKVSIVTPTLNSSRTIKEYFQGICSQVYPGELEVVIVDGGSLDNTLTVAKKYKAKIIKNPLKTAEAGKAIGVKHTTGQIIAFIDSDNVISEKNWLQRLVQPFLENQEVIASEPMYFTYREKDHWLTRYFALIGMGDPLSLFIGNYDRYSFISNKWTELDIKYEENTDYLILHLFGIMPTIGANGFLIKKSELNKYPIKDYLFDIDILKFLNQDYPIVVAKVKIGIVHLFTGTIGTFLRKQRRRIKDFLYFQKKGFRAQNGVGTRVIIGIIIFALSCLFIIPLFLQMIIGFIRKPDKAWLFHPLACWLTLCVYGIETIYALVKGVSPFERRNWSQ